MKKILSFLSALMISAGLAFAQPAPVVPLRLYDEGVSRGYVTSINCVGGGVVCTASAYAGVVTITAGSGIATDGSSTTTATIPFAAGIDVTGLIDGSGDTTALFIHVPLAQTAFAGRVDGYYTDGWRFDGEWKTNNASIGNAFTFQDSTVWAPTATLQNGWSFGASPVVKGSVNGGYLYGVLSSPFTASSGSTYSGVMSSVAAFEAQQFIGSGTFTNYYMYHGQQLGGSGTITNMYGLYLPAITKGGTLNYAIYTNGGLVRFGDNVSTTGSVTAGSLTSGRVPIASTGGLLVDDSDMTFATDTLTVTKIAATTFTGDVTLSTKNLVTDTTTGTKIGTATTQKLGFFNATPVVQESGSNDVLASLVTLGLRGASNNPAFNIGTGAITAGSANLSSSLTVALGVNNSGGMNVNQATKTSNATLNSFDYDIWCDATSGNVTITLAAISGQNKRNYNVTKIDSSANTCTITANGAETLNGNVSNVLRNQWDSMMFSNNTASAWYARGVNLGPGYAKQTSVNCSTSGTVNFSQPFYGPSYKAIEIYAAACLGTASYTYPVAFTNTPQVLSQSLAAVATSVSTTAVTITGSTTTGFLELNGY